MTESPIKTRVCGIRGLLPAALWLAAGIALLYSPCGRASTVEGVSQSDITKIGGATGGDYIKVFRNDDSTVEVLHVWTNATENADAVALTGTSGATGTFTIPTDSIIDFDTIRVLAVGGGGAGGGDCGGGGGGGGLVYSNAWQAASGTYAITVGAGGTSTARAAAGGDGADSTIVLSGTPIFQALGGGGGAYCNSGGGRDGGSGGGTSRNKPSEPGVARQADSAYTVSPGYGNNGGNGVSAYHGSGGGGAGAAGSVATTSKGGKGGDGLAFDITGEEVYYAGGGGGGGNLTSAANEGAGGNGGGGAGSASYNAAAGLSGSKGIGQSGTDGLGGGGGGGGGDNAATRGGAGGSGIIAIRYTLSGVDPISFEADKTTSMEGEPIYSFKTTGSSSVLFRRSAEVRALVIGGGGSGGSGSVTPTQGAPGGGGAGGMIDTNQLFSVGVHQVYVGAGGVVADTSSTARRAGTDGEDTYLAFGATTNLLAYGGGGGGVTTGNSGGSGGGGSKSSGGAARQPTSSWGGFGFAGGKSSANQSGGGGGGAGGIGGSTSTANVGAAGGAGRESDITGEAVIYAAGGGGGSRAGTGGAGGSGIGGAGGGSASKAGGNGEANTGSGGGGSANAGVGGSGGSGIVVLRVKRYMPYMPQTEYSAIWDGTEHEFYTVEEATSDILTITLDDGGTAIPTNRIAISETGTNTYTVTLKDGYLWADGSAASSVTVKAIIEPTPATIDYFGFTGTAGWQLNDEQNLPVVTVSPAGAVSDLTVWYAPKSVTTEPGGDGWTSDPADLVEAGDWQAVAVVAATAAHGGDKSDTLYFTLWNPGDYGDAATDLLAHRAIITVDGYTGSELGVYPVEIEIEEQKPLGFRYADAAADGSDVRFSVWRDDGGVATPEFLPYEYTDGWNPSGATKVKIWVPEFANGREITMSWGRTTVEGELPETSWRGRIYESDIIVSGWTGDAVANLPMAVRIANDSPKGFDYRQCQAEGADLRFVFKRAVGGTYVYSELPFEIEGAWNTNGTTIAWVKVPNYRDGTVATMIWGTTNIVGTTEYAPAMERTLPASDVWSGYAGVWHFDESDLTADSSANAPSATIGAGYSGAGVFGGGIGNSTQGNAMMRVAASEALDSLTNGAFRVSLWANITGSVGSWPYFFGRNTNQNGPGWAARIATGSIAPAGTALRMYWATGTYKTLNVAGLAADEWVRMDFTYAPGRVECWINGELNQYSDDAAIVPANGNSELAIGGWQGSGGSVGLLGVIDEFRVSAETPTASRIKAEYIQGGADIAAAAGVTQDFEANTIDDTSLTYTLSPRVTSVGAVVQNRWLQVRTSFLSAEEWYIGHEPDCVLDDAAYGVPLLVFEDVTGVRTAGWPTVAGTYLAYAAVEAKTDSANYGWTALEYEIGRVNVLVSRDTQNLGGSASGRVLLANDDYAGVYDAADEGAVKGQSYDLVVASPDPDTGTYWVHGPAEPQTYYSRLSEETVHTFYASTPQEGLCDSDLLWHMSDVRIGNTYPPSVVDYASYNNLVYLPWSSTGRPRLSGVGAAGQQAESSHLVMRNITGAAIYSPCYKEGIGTIYFDAANSNIAEDGDNYQLSVYFSTNALEVTTYTYVTNFTDDGEIDTIVTNKIVTSGLLPTDDVLGKDLDGNVDYTKAEWHRLTMHPLKKDGASSFETLDATETLGLAIANGGSYENFYRIYIPVAELYNYHGPIRFKIQRETAPVRYKLDAGGFILIDNIQVSYPPMRVDLSPEGKGIENDDSASDGDKNVLGCAGAFISPFPSVMDYGAIYGRAATTAITNAMASVDPGEFVMSATMHYRWRYYNQTNLSWKSESLVKGDGFRTVNPLSLPEDQNHPGERYLPGDIEFFYEVYQSAPYYTYRDFSGLSLGVPGYTEQISTITNAYWDRAITPVSELSSCGTNWFVRLRSGKSDWEYWQVEFRTVSGSATNVTPAKMYMTGNHTWRYFRKTLTNDVSEVAFRFRAVNGQESGGKWSENAKLYRVSPDATHTGSTVTGEIEEIAESDWDDANDWCTVGVDGTSGHILFHVDDSANSATVVHASYQDFDAWSDAYSIRTPFQGAFTSASEVGPVTGVSEEKKIARQDFTGWTATTATNALWTETFLKTSAAFGMEPNVPFDSWTTPNGWASGPGMLVKQEFDEAGNIGNFTNYALQVSGDGNGFIQFANASTYPRGLEKVTFRARIAQSQSEDAVCYYDPYDKKNTEMRNYAFCARAGFDENKLQDFRGLASLSLIAYYVPNRGFYEFRIEKTGSGTSGGQQRMRIVKWLYDKKNKVYNSTNVVCTGGRNGWPTTAGIPQPTSTNGLMGVFFSVSNVVETVSAGSAQTNVVIVAGFSEDTKGFSPIPGGAGSNSVTNQNGNYEVLILKDTTSTKLTSGTFGFMSCNSPAVYFNPFWREAALNPVSETEIAASVNAVNRSSRKAVDFGGFVSLRGDTGSSEWDDSNCWWCGNGRLEPFKSSSDATQWGLRASVSPQKVAIYTGAAGSGTWSSTPFKIVSVEGFGAMSNYVADVMSTDDLVVKLATMKGYTDDVVLDDITMYQFAGSSWSDHNGATIPGWANIQSAAGLTNIIFTSAWIMDTKASSSGKALRLSAKRTKPGARSSIRSPLFDGDNHRGIGLGMVSFSYRNTDENTQLAVQIATNVTAAAIAQLDSNDAYWTTYTNFTFAAGESGVKSVYLGMHGVQGAIRIMVPTNAMNKVSSVTDSSKFGEITITGIKFTDEPDINYQCWWGWNVRTAGDGSADTEKRMMLGNNAGLAMALNNSTIYDIKEDDKAVYKRHLPFVQSPTFGTNFVGEISFKARKYLYTSADTNATHAAVLNARPAWVTVYGSESGEEDIGWVKLTDIAISNDVYTTYTYQAPKGTNGYRAIRLAVRGVGPTDEEEGVTVYSDATDGDGSRETPDGGIPVRVLIEDVAICERVSARLGFRNVGAFRSSLDKTYAVTNVPSKAEQPLNKESWGVQCELYRAMMPEKIVIDDKHQPKVTLYWYTGDKWGYSQWADEANVATLAKASDWTEERMYYRSSYDKGGVISLDPADDIPGTVVQYMLKVEYTIKNDLNEEEDTSDVLDAGQWKRPSWYNPIDLVAKNGGRFAAYNILDSVAPGWAWVNEVNLFGGYKDDGYGDNYDIDGQFIEIAAPKDADLSYWYVNVLEWQPSGRSGIVITNRVAYFGDGKLSGEKTAGEDPDSEMVFHVIASPLAESRLKSEFADSAGRYDVGWEFPNADLSSGFTADGEIFAPMPVAVQLVRPSGILEHEIVAIGTNTMGKSASSQSNPEYAASRLNSALGSNFIYVGADNAFDDDCHTNSVSVLTARGEDATNWVNTAAWTPGRINAGQKIDGVAPKANGNKYLVRARIVNDGNITQKLADDPESTVDEMNFYLTKGIEVTNIVYTVKKWLEVGSVTDTESGRALTPVDAGGGEYVLTIGGPAQSNAMTIVANAQLSRHLREDWGIEGSRYKDAILSWLQDGRTMRGEFANPDATELTAAAYHSLWPDTLPSDGFITNLTLETMYQLDMDPTIGSRLKLRAGVCSAPSMVPFDYDLDGTYDITNVLIGYKMYIQQWDEAMASVEHEWAPYTLRGMGGETSFAGETGNNWTSATFKVTGRIINGKTDDRDWVPLRYFVFAGTGTGSSIVSTSFDSDFTTKVELIDPYSPYSLGAATGWQKALKTGWLPIFFSWALDDRSMPVSVETMEKENRYE